MFTVAGYFVVELEVAALVDGVAEVEQLAATAKQEPFAILTDVAVAMFNSVFTEVTRVRSAA